MSEETTAAPVTTDTPAASDTPAWTGPEWLKDMPDDVKSDKSLHKYTSHESAARGLINAQRMIGMEKVPRPRGDFDPKNPDWAAFLEAAGTPKTPDEYKFDKNSIPEGMGYDDALEGKFKEISHTAGLNNKQAALIRDGWLATMAEAQQAAQLAFAQSKEASEAELQKELGQAYEPTVNAAKAALKSYADEKFVKWLDDNGLGNHPEIVRVFGKIGKEMLGDQQLKTPAGSSFKTPSDFKSEWETFRQANWGALADRGHPDHARLAKQEWELAQKAFPS